MEGFGHWDLVLWIVAAYIAVMALVRMMLYALKASSQRSYDQTRDAQSHEPSATDSKQTRRAA